MAKDKDELTPEELADQAPTETDEDEDLDSLDDGSDFGDEAEEAEEEPEDDEEEPEDDEAEEESDEEESDGKDDEESDDEDEDEAEEESDDKDDDKAKKSEPRIPKSRFDAINARLREERERNAELAGKLQETDKGSEEANRVSTIQSRLGEIDEEMSAALLDADSKKISALRAEERELMSQANRIELDERSAEVRRQARYDVVVDQVERDYPQLNPDSDQFDRELMAETNQYRMKFMKAGDDPETALREAISIAYPRHYPDEATAEEVQESLRDTPKKPKRDTSTPKKRNKKAAASQPADTSTRRSQAKADELPDITTMSDEEFDRLTPAQLAKLGGDFAE